MKINKIISINFFLLGIVNAFIGIIAIYIALELNSAITSELAELTTLVTFGVVFGILELALGVASLMSFYTLMKEKAK